MKTALTLAFRKTSCSSSKEMTDANEKMVYLVVKYFVQNMVELSKNPSESQAVFRLGESLNGDGCARVKHASLYLYVKLLLVSGAFI